MRRHSGVDDNVGGDGRNVDNGARGQEQQNVAAFGCGVRSGIVASASRDHSVLVLREYNVTTSCCGLGGHRPLVTGAVQLLT